MYHSDWVWLPSSQCQRHGEETGLSVFSLPVVGLFDYNPRGVRCLLTKFGSTQMGLESHAFAVNDIRWLGVHIFDQERKCLIDESALQPWVPSDERVFSGVQAQVMEMGSPHYAREIQQIGEYKVKAEFEALNSRGFDSLEQRIIQKILRKTYF